MLPIGIVIVGGDEAVLLLRGGRWSSCQRSKPAAARLAVVGDRLARHLRRQLGEGRPCRYGSFAQSFASSSFDLLDEGVGADLVEEELDARLVQVLAQEAGQVTLAVEDAQDGLGDADVLAVVDARRTPRPCRRGAASSKCRRRRASRSRGPRCRLRPCACGR